MIRVRRAALAAALGLLPAPWAARMNAPPRETAPPTLVVLVSVDQMRADYLDRFGPQLTGGFARLTREGAVFTHAYQDHGIPETAAGHASLLSGRHPSSTGIVRNDEGVRDATTPLVESSGPGAAPTRFHGTTLVDWLLAHWSSSRTLSVSGKDRAAILMVGRPKQSVYWYEGGKFTTSRYYTDSLPDWVRRFNRGAVTARAPGRLWDLLLPVTAYAEPDAMPYENFGRDIAFPHRFPADTAAALRAFTNSPYLDSLTLAFAMTGLQVLDLGRGPAPDLLAIGLSATDRIGHGWGPDSRELHDQILRLDRWLGVFLDSLARLRGRSSLLVVLTADHGVAAFPEWARAHGEPGAGYVNVDTAIARWRAALRAQAGDSTLVPFPYREYGLVTLNRAGLRARGIDPDSVVEGLRADLARIPGVLRVDTPRSLAGADTTDDVARRWIHMLPPDLQVAVLITPRPGVIFSPPGPGNARHGQLSEDVVHVPIVLWGEGIRPGRYADRANTVDIGPTLARLLGIAPTEPVQGRLLREALNEGP